MANRYWVGGTGTWDASTTTNWSATSGGAGGASAPTSADNVFFDGGSDAGAGFTVTIATGAICNDITVSGLDQAMILAGTGNWTINGSLSFPATNLSYTASGTVTFTATSTGKTITTNGVNMVTCSATFNGIGGEWTLGSACTIGSGPLALTLTNGSFVTNNFNVTGGFLVSNNTNSGRSFTLGSSTLTFNRTASSIQLNSTGLTFNAGTSSFVLNGAGAVIDVTGGVTFYNVSFTSTSAGAITITGANTYNNLTFTSLAATGMRNISIGANQTVNGTLTYGTANTAIRRMFVFSDVIGTPRTITAAAIAAIADVDFRDIVAAGASGTWAGTRLGNCLGNSNITFDAGKTVYWNLATGGFYSSQGWALTSGGATAINNTPLAQDTIIHQNTGLNSGASFTFDQSWNVGTINIGSRTLPMTYTCNALPVIYGDVTLSSYVTITGTGLFTFSSNVNQTITSAGKTFTQTITNNKPAGSLILADSFTVSNQFILTRGTLDLNNFNLTATTFSSNNINVRSIAFGTGQINLTGNNATVFAMQTATNFIYTGTPTVNLTYAGAVGTRNCNLGSAAGGSEVNAIDVNITGGTDDCRTTGDFRNINYTGFSGVSPEVGRRIYGNITFSATMTPAGNTTAITFLKSSGVQSIVSNGYTIDHPINKPGAGTLQLQDNLTQGATRGFTLTSGSIDLNGNDLTVGIMSTTGATARSINHGIGGDLHVLGATFTASGSNITTSGTGSISMDSASSKTFAGGGFTYQKLNQGGAGTLVITGANTFADITNTVRPCQINFPASVTTTVSDLSVNGTSGNLVKLRSSISGTRANIVVV